MVLHLEHMANTNNVLLLLIIKFLAFNTLYT